MAPPLSCETWSHQSVHLVSFHCHAPRKDHHWADGSQLLAILAVRLQPHWESCCVRGMISHNPEGRFPCWVTWWFLFPTNLKYCWIAGWMVLFPNYFWTFIWILHVNVISPGRLLVLGNWRILFGYSWCNLQHPSFVKYWMGWSVKYREIWKKSSVTSGFTRQQIFKFEALRSLAMLRRAPNVGAAPTFRDVGQSVYGIWIETWKVWECPMYKSIRKLFLDVFGKCSLLLHRFLFGCVQDKTTRLVAWQRCTITGMQCKRDTNLTSILHRSEEVTDLDHLPWAHSKHADMVDLMLIWIGISAVCLKGIDISLIGGRNPATSKLELVWNGTCPPKWPCWRHSRTWCDHQAFCQPLQSQTHQWRQSDKKPSALTCSCHSWCPSLPDRVSNTRESHMK